MGFLNDPQILTARLRKPMIRKNGVMEEVEWKEAIQYTAERLSAIKEKYGPDSIMGTAPHAAREMKPIMSCKSSCGRSLARTILTIALVYATALLWQV